MLETDLGTRSSHVARPFGLTGGIASGKSTVARFFADLGAYIIDADRIGHEVIEPGQEAYRDILQRFGREVLDASDRIDRRKLGREVFADPQKLRLLDSVVHPRVFVRIEQLAAEQHRRNPRSVVIVDAPLVFESGLNHNLRKVIVVWCRPEQQIERLMAKRGMPQAEAERRIRAQMPMEEKRRRADFQIDCSGTLEQSRAQAETIYQELLRLT